MAYFPGNALIIDEKISLLYSERPKGTDGAQYDALKFVDDYFKTEGVPIYYLDSGFDNAEEITNKIKLFQNVRFIVLDLALTGDEPGDVDEALIKLIIEECIKKFGYFFLFINSAHIDFWKGVKSQLKEYEKQLENSTIELDKTKFEDLQEKVRRAPETKYSLNLIYQFESELNRARDNAFSSFMDFNKDTWEEIFSILQNESGSFSSFDLTTIFLSFLKQNLSEVEYPVQKEKEKREKDDGLLKKIHKHLYYLKFPPQSSVWTGNVYQTKGVDEHHERRYALIINPECDLAQNKHLKYKVVYGFEINETTFPDYPKGTEFKAENVPLFVNRSDKGNDGKWKSFNDLNKLKSPNQYTYLLPFASQKENAIIFDFRDSESLVVLPESFELLFRINDPMITEILDRYSGLYNRKGLMGFPWDGVKLK